MVHDVIEIKSCIQYPCQRNCVMPQTLTAPIPSANLQWVYMKADITCTSCKSWKCIFVASSIIFLLIYFKWCDGCNCTSYLINQGFYLNETFTTTPAPTTTPPENITYPPYDIVDPHGTSVMDKPDVSPHAAQASCGVQIYSGLTTDLVVYTVVQSL